MGGVLNVTSPSDLNKRITLQYETRTPDGMGGFTVAWVDAATVWAKKTTHRSDEAVQAMATTGTAIHNFRIQWRADVQSSWRIKHGNSYMNIIGPPIEKVEGSQRYLDITAKEAA
jgi:SPP1 family predicted phage head-tail adaptor